MSLKPLWVAAPATMTWRLIVNLAPKNRSVVPQYAVQIDGGWALTQGQDNETARNATDHLIFSRFDHSGRLLETRVQRYGGHGDRCYPIGGHLVTQVKGIWARVTFGSPWSWRGTKTPARCTLKPLAGISFQGECSLGGGRWARLYGGSIKADPKWHPGENAFLHIIDGGKVVRKIDLDHVARDENGTPIGGRYEPEGVSIATIDGIKYLTVGFSVGQLGNTTMNLYGCPLAALD